MSSALDHPPTGPFWAVSFLDAFAAADFLSRLEEFVTSLGTPAGLVAWIRAPQLGAGGDARCCAYLSAEALRAADEAGLPTRHAEPVATDELPAARIAVVGAPR